ncbi:TauD/TfdA dioxygenase family protein [Actinomadura parmotrematis]|uniref:TauD/TfdA family dioxygenase n=1 Tax=Actinomadura parmotrematis TaxID=2864039 RepID=A0ABS7FVP8_9ACTN|nr:TauD/TfdA family dioxygenase [Actinomadura parmotrematis]MBW8483518.1 TauD/TfdA family dioxygenase [Actinomadura parmotrematis]
MTHQVLDPVTPVTRAGAVEVSPVAGRIGAEVCSVRLSGELDGRTVAELRRALLRHKVLFFRGQYHLDAAGQAAFARLLGTPAAALPAPDGAWHADASYAERPPGFAVLRAVEVPAYGGDTVWANTVAAYDDLPVELRELADRLWVLHSDELTAGGGDAARAEHPLVRVHPETGERALLLGGFARSVVGLSTEADSEALIRLFQERVTRLENTVRWRWAPGDVAVWDNRATQHRVVHDFPAGARRLHLTAVEGEAPLAVDGRRGVPLP